jgi:UDP-3-O-[3-hydroxymyristoyl] glucosamine N-acyltransferase
MQIDNKVLLEIAGISVKAEYRFDGIGNLSKRSFPNMLSWLLSDKYLDEMISNPCIKGVIVVPELEQQIPQGIIRIVHDDPMVPVSKLCDKQAKDAKQIFPNEIHPNAQIHPTAFIADHNVRIGAGTIIEPHAVIMPDVQLGENCLIRSGAVLGSDNFSKFRSRKGLVTGAYSIQGVRIGDEVEIGYNSCIDKGDSGMDTCIGAGTKIHNLCQVSHGAQLGKDCILWGGVFLSGFCELADRVQIQPSSVVSNYVKIGADAYIGIHSVVTHDVEAGKTFLGSRQLASKDTLDKLKASFNKK